MATRTGTASRKQSPPHLLKTWEKHLTAVSDHNSANAAKKSVHIHYLKKSTGKVVKRRVEPRGIKNGLLHAYDHKRKAHRTFLMERIKHMEKTGFWDGFAKQATIMGAVKNQAPHIAEVAGLGILAAPAIQKLRGKPMGEDAASKAEIAGLGVLAAPSLAHMLRRH